MLRKDEPFQFMKQTYREGLRHRENDGLFSLKVGFCAAVLLALAWHLIQQYRGF